MELHKKPTYFGISATKKILKLAKLLEISLDTSANYELPLLPNTNFFDTDSEIFDPPRLFQSIMGTLSWISGSVCPENITACNKFSHFQANHRLIHFRLAKRVVKYLLNTSTYGIKYEVISLPLNIHVYVDSNFERQNGKFSTYGFIIYVNSQIYKAKSKRFTQLATSTCLVETWAMLAAIPEVKQLQKMLTELQQPIDTILFYCDNKATVDIFSEVKLTPAVRSLDLRDLAVRQEFIKNKCYDITFIPTRCNIADFFTKLVPRDLFLEFRNQMISNLLYCGYFLLKIAVF